MSYALAYIQAQKKREVVKEVTNIINLDFRKPKTYYSELLEDSFTILDNGEIKFNSGVYYNKKELEKINSLDDKGKKHIHSLKRIFNGEVI